MGMYNHYVVAYVTDNMDLYHEEFVEEQDARQWIAEHDEYKALLIKVENIADCGAKATAISVEDHT